MLQYADSIRLFVQPGRRKELAKALCGSVAVTFMVLVLLGVRIEKIGFVFHGHRQLEQNAHFRSGRCRLLRDIRTVVVIFDESVGVRECSYHHHCFDSSDDFLL